MSIHNSSIYNTLLQKIYYNNRLSLHRLKNIDEEIAMQITILLGLKKLQCNKRKKTRTVFIDLLII